MPSSLDASIFAYVRVPKVAEPVGSYGGKAEDEGES